MGSKIQEEIKQTTPFETLQQEEHMNLTCTAEMLTHRLEQEFKPFGLTVTQCNVLRIVRAGGIAQRDICGPLVTETPDVPRSPRNPGFKCSATSRSAHFSIMLELAPGHLGLIEPGQQ
jgi:hypothetical protein